MSVPTITERSERPCDDENEPCMFMTGGYCMLPACQYCKINERIVDRFIIPCRYHMTVHEYVNFVDNGVLPKGFWKWLFP